MSVKKILQLGTPLLWERSAPVIDAHDSSIQSIIRDLDDTLAWFRSTAGWGRGISAPQIGELARISFIRMDEKLSRESRLLTVGERPFDPGSALVLVNPSITWSSPETFTLWDDCFSFPDLLVKVSRNESIEVAYTDPDGNSHCLLAQHGLSELLQHELDHLDGILAIDRRIDDHSLATRSALQQLQILPG
jgi:peptide deformylase